MLLLVYLRHRMHQDSINLVKEVRNIICLCKLKCCTLSVIHFSGSTGGSQCSYREICCRIYNIFSCKNFVRYPLSRFLGALEAPSDIYREICCRIYNMFSCKNSVRYPLSRFSGALEAPTKSVSSPIDSDEYECLVRIDFDSVESVRFDRLRVDRVWVRRGRETSPSPKTSSSSSRLRDVFVFVSSPRRLRLRLVSETSRRRRRLRLVSETSPSPKTSSSSSPSSSIDARRKNALSTHLCTSLLYIYMRLYKSPKIEIKGKRVINCRVTMYFMMKSNIIGQPR